MSSALPGALKPSVIPRLLPEFVEFWNEALADKPATNDLPWSPEIRKQPPQPGGSDPLTVGSVQDISLSKFTVRVFTPEGNPPEKGWPVMIYFHGGGWTLGNIKTENVMSSHLCKRANVVVVSVDYRLAPEEPFPAAADDACEALEWVVAKGKDLLRVDTSRIAVGGSSSGANLAAVAAHHAALRSPPVPILFQYLNVPVVDNTAPAQNPTDGPHPYPSWVENADTPSLTPAKMLWFRNNYLPSTPSSPNPSLTSWRSSPIFASDEAFSRSPAATFVGVCEIDVLRDEGIVYSEKLKKHGAKNVEVKVYKGAPHPVMAMDKRLKVGRECIDDAVAAAARALGTTLTPL